MTYRRVATWLILIELGVSVARSNPTITSEPRTQFQWQGRRLSLSVTVAGPTPSGFQWQFDDRLIPGATNRTLVIANAQLADDGLYKVIVSDNSGTATSQVARVMIRAWPAPTGPRIPELARLDTNMQVAMLNHTLPGGSLAVVKDGRLVFARGYGFADVENSQPYQPDSLCRSGSLAKTITAASVMKLVEQGKLNLEESIFHALELEPPLYPGATFDSRWTNITVRQVLYHSGGWNSDTALSPLGQRGFDPTSWPNTIARDLSLTTQPTPSDLVRWVLGKRLQFTPGTTTVYSNFGYDLLGTLVEKRSGVSYEEAARQLLAQAQITRMRVGGNSRAERRAGEVVYYLHPSLTLTGVYALYEPRPLDFDLPYAWPVSLYAADGGWLISAVDFARFVAAIDGDKTYPDILSTNSVSAMLTRGKFPGPQGDYYGIGWDSVSPSTGVWYKTGGDTGNFDLAMHRKNGVILAFTFNTTDHSPAWTALVSLQTSVDHISQWPSHDLFPASLSYEAWRAKYFTNLTSSISADSADPDGDGQPNLLEFAQGTNPLVLSVAPPLGIQFDKSQGDGVLDITFRRPLSSELSYALASSKDLHSWDGLIHLDGSELSLNEDGSCTAHARVLARELGGATFFRLVVALPPSGEHLTGAFP